MTALQLVRRARGRLAAAILAATLLWAVAGALAVVVVFAIADALVALPSLVRVLLLPLAAAAALAGAVTVLWRGRAVRSLQRVALWIEERQPQLRFALVTAIDPRIAPLEHHAALHAQAMGADLAGTVGRAWRRPLARAAVTVLILSGAMALLQPRDLLSAAGTELLRRAGSGTPAPMANRLDGMVARVDPPAYTRMGATTIEDPTAVAALIGSRITFGGAGPPDGVSAVIGDDSLHAAADRRNWAIRTAMPEKAAVIAFHDRSWRRLVVLEPRADSVPAVRLELPANDTTYQTVPRGALVVEAAITDDIGIDHAYVEYMLSTGSNESFETRTTRGPRTAFRNAPGGTLRETVNLDTLRLAPGTVLHIRVVAFDYNEVTGPGRGVSDTRTLRIAEPVDSTSINPTPPLPIDSMWLSQRLLNMKTDTLIRTGAQLERREFTNRSAGYGNAQEDIRQRAMAVIAMLEDDAVGGSFATEISTMLREAVELMYDARVHLAIAEPDSAMPIMIEILAILDEIRLANRYYLRGLLRPVAVNVERVRHTGEDPAADERRRPRSELNDAYAALAERIARAALLVDTAPQAALDSLTYIRVAALSDAPHVAEALAEAIARLSRGASADSALARTRRALEPPPVRRQGPVEWRGIYP